MNKLIFCALTFTLLAGCATSPSHTVQDASNTDVILPVPTDVKQTPSGFRTSAFSDRKVKLEVDDNNDIKILLLVDSSDFDILDASAFAVGLYRTHLQSKLITGDTLSDRDLALFEFVLQTQLATLEALAIKAKTAITERPRPGKSLSAYIADNQPLYLRTSQLVLDECMNNAVSVFFEKGNELSTMIEDWARGYHLLSAESRQLDIDRIVNSQLRQMKNPWWFRIKDFEDQTLQNYKYFFVPKEVASLQWKNLYKSVCYYVTDTATIVTDAATYLSKTVDSHSKRQIENSSIRMRGRLEQVLRQFRAVYCDYPFSVACCRSYVLVQSRKGFFNDKEYQMKQDASDFAIYVSGTEMLKTLSSSYSASLYTDLLALLKSELGPKTYATLTTTHKLFEYDSIVFAESLLKENALVSN